MEIMRINHLYNNDFRENEMIRFTKNLGYDEVLTNGIYYAKIGKNLKVKVHWLHNNHTGRDLGIVVNIINPNVGTIDILSVRFDECWGCGFGVIHVCMNSSNYEMPVTDEQKNALTKIIHDFVSIYKEV